eukprot:COSAG02_NODE_72055_length_188_cov_25.044944_1_plen_41_part_01
MSGILSKCNNPGNPADPAVRVFPDTSLTNVIFNPKRWKVLY